VKKFTAENWGARLMCDGITVNNDELFSDIKNISDIDNKNYEYFNFLPYAI
jgi:hypothetical protein